MVRICEHTGKKAPGGRQTLLVSATLTPRVLQMCAPWCPNPRSVFVGAAPAAAEAAAAEAAAAAAAGQAAERAERAAGGEPAGEPRERRPAWGWGDAKAPSADAADYFPGKPSFLFCVLISVCAEPLRSVCMLCQAVAFSFRWTVGEQQLRTN